ncbi:MAG TPA: cupin domain-containing protein [Azospirillum sp.]|nr:cupin domain-containing protein [Azospirillum sp.]
MGSAGHDWNTVPEREAGDGVWSKTLVGEGVIFRHLRLKAGTEAAPHDHPHEQWLHVLSGRATVRCDDGEHELRAGVMLHLPAHTRHAATFHEETVMVEVNVTGA